MQERRQMILQQLDEKGTIRVSELKELTGCSEVTLRNDLKMLELDGLLRRTHGGAIKPERKSDRKYSAESVYRHVDRKKQIAACAYEYIEDRDTIILDDASSSFYLAVHIKNHPGKYLAVVTNSLLVGNELSDVKHVDLYMVGGHVGGHLAATMGDSAVNNIEQFHVDKGFIGVHGINFQAGLTSIATPQMEVKRAILKAAEKVFVLADSGKFGGGYVSVICPLRDVDKIITDNQVSAEVIKMAEKEQVSLVVANPAGK